nr:glycosyltransferase [uncultured Dyadobacter sp.]
MIPKTIHYCWFGRGKMPELADRCIESWKKYLPDYTLQLWNEDTFDISSVPYVREAYEARKFAFVTDYVRLYAIYNYGGIYMDTDVEVLKSLDDLLHLPAFSGFESETEIPTGIMASELSGKWAAEQLQYYDGKHFRRPDGSYDMTTNVEIISGIMAANGFVLKNGYQVYRDCMHMFPKDYFCPKSRSGVITLTPNSYCIHHFEGSWQPKRVKIKKFFFKRIVGPKLTDFLIRMKKKLYYK